MRDKISDESIDGLIEIEKNQQSKAHRNGLRRFKHSDLQQIKTFLKAYYFHSIGELEKAITFYTESLK